MRLRLVVLLFAASLASATPAGARVAKVVSVTMFLRHGIRAPLPGEIPDAAAPALAQGWATPPGGLTAKGYANARLLGRWLGRTWRAQHLLRAGCPGVADLSVRANNAARTIDSARALLAGAFPACGLEPIHLPAGEVDALFDPIGAGEPIDVDAVRTMLPATSASLWAPHARSIARLHAIIGCRTQADCLRALPDRPITVDAKGVHLDARSKAFAGAAQGLLLRYAEGLPMPRIGNRPVEAAGIARLSRLHAVPFIVEARSPGMAPVLAARFLDELDRQVAPGAQTARIRVFVGHDNVLSAITAQLGIDFEAPGYGVDDPPIGGGFGFELIEAADGERRVRGFYLAQSPDQLRRSSALTGHDQPWKRYFVLRGCPSPAARGSPLPRFRALSARFQPPRLRTVGRASR